MSNHSKSLSRRDFNCALALAPFLGSSVEAAASSSPALPATEGLGAHDEALSPFPLNAVTLLPGPLLEAQNASASYMRRIDPRRLLHCFRVNAGLPSNAKPLGGWEAPDCEIRGHFTGHYLSACAMMAAATGDREWVDRCRVLISGFAECQKALNQGGYLSAFPLEHFDRLDARAPVWAPFYVIHKIMAGLLDAHQLTGDQEALQVLLGLAGWVDDWTAKRPAIHMQDILNTECGGMGDVLYRLVRATGDSRWMAAADRFEKSDFMTPLAAGRDELIGLHQNMHIPLVIGAAERYEITRDRASRDLSEFFWRTVSQRRSYASGGSGTDEFWRSPPGDLASYTTREYYLSRLHQECCCAYNMMKLSRKLHLWKPDCAYMDYYERNLFNHRLGTVDPNTGRTIYHLSLEPISKKRFATEEDSFWCCNGTGIEEFSKIADSLYFRKGDSVYVNLFAASNLKWPERGIEITQHTKFPESSGAAITLDRTNGKVWPILVRIPSWTDNPILRVNGRPVEVSSVPGSYVRIVRAWKTGDRIELDMPMRLRFERLSGQSEVGAIMYGPLLLAGQLPGQKAPDTVDGGGFTVTSPLYEPAWLPNFDESQMERDVRPTADATTFTVGPHDITLLPLYKSYEAYIPYWRAMKQKRVTDSSLS